MGISFNFCHWISVQMLSLSMSGEICSDVVHKFSAMLICPLFFAVRNYVDPLTTRTENNLLKIWGGARNVAQSIVQQMAGPMHWTPHTIVSILLIGRRKILRKLLPLCHVRALGVMWVALASCIIMVIHPSIVCRIYMGITICVSLELIRVRMRDERRTICKWWTICASVWDAHVHRASACMRAQMHVDQEASVIAGVHYHR